MFCSRLNENSRQAKVSKLSLVLWLNENVRFRGSTAGHVSGKRLDISRTGTSGVVSYTQSWYIRGSLGIRRDISCTPAVWTPLSETTMFFLI